MGKFIDISGQKFGRLTAIKRIEDSVAKSGKRQPQWLCSCECGNTAICQAGNLKSGKSTSCGCYWKERHSTATVNDLKGKRFGRLLVIERAEDLLDGKLKTVAWKCVCDCGNEIIVRGYNLKSGATKSCGCYNIERTIESNTTNHSFEKFNSLTIMPFYEYRTCGSSKVKYWMCLCDCGKIIFAQYSSLTSDNIRSCGCINCSSGERKIRNVLDQYKIKYESEFYFKDLKSDKNGYLRFDFALFDREELICLIEFQGIQHYENIEFGKQQREITDNIKREYCKNKNIKLYEIPYDKDAEEIIVQIIYENSVPSLH